MGKSNRTIEKKNSVWAVIFRTTKEHKALSGGLFLCHNRCNPDHASSAAGACPNYRWHYQRTGAVRDAYFILFRIPGVYRTVGSDSRGIVDGVRTENDACASQQLDGEIHESYH